MNSKKLKMARPCCNSTPDGKSFANLKSILFLFLFFSFSVCIMMESRADIPIAYSGVYITEQQIAAVRANYELVPEPIRLTFEKNGNVIYFFDDQPLLGNLTGVYVGREGIRSSIVLSNKGNGGAQSIIHEMGHFFDDILFADQNTEYHEMEYRGFVFHYTTEGQRVCSGGEEFQRIWASEALKNSAVSPYERTSPEEYFAGIFKAYVTNPTFLQNVAPLSFMYMHRLVQDFTARNPVTDEFRSQAGNTAQEISHLASQAAAAESKAAADAEATIGSYTPSDGGVYGPGGNMGSEGPAGRTEPETFAATDKLARTPTGELWEPADEVDRRGGADALKW